MEFPFINKVYNCVWRSGKRKGKQMIRISAILAVLLLSIVSPSFADWSYVDKINAHQKEYWDHLKTGPIQKPGAIQKPGNIQVPKGIQAIKQSSAGCQHKLTVSSDTLFDFDKSALTTDAEVTLKALDSLLQKEGNHPIRVEGHTDAIGSIEYNLALSQRRAQAVKDWLLAHNLAVSSTPIVGRGKSEPVAPNTKSDGTDNPEGRQKNRRVEIIIDTCATGKEWTDPQKSKALSGQHL